MNPSSPPPPPSSTPPPMPQASPTPPPPPNKDAEPAKKSGEEVAQKTSIYSIKCTNCAAPLKILGGGRVTTVTCQYCNSVLDIADKYKVVAQFHEKYRPPVPFTLGMQGSIKGVEWTIIGWVAYKTVDFPIERWSEFFLYSPLYGYGWLIYEEGVVSFSRRVRDFPLREWYEKGKAKSRTGKYDDYSVAEYEEANYNINDKDAPKSVFYKKDHYLLAEEPYIVEVDFVQGELSWIAKVDDKVKCWDYNSMKRKSLSIEKTGIEIEVYQNEKLDNKAIYESFGVKKEKQTQAKQTTLDKVFEDETLDKTEANLSSFAKYTSLLVAILLLFIIASAFSSKTLVKNKNNQPFEQMFTVSSDAFISRIDIKAPSPTVLNYASLTIYKADKKVFSINKDHIYPINSKFHKTWEKGDNEVRVYIKLTEGLYRASFELSKQPHPNEIITVEIKEKIIRLLYILPLFVIMLLVLIPSIVKNIIPPSKKKFVWWGIGGVIGFAIFGAGILVFIVAFYFFVQPIIDGRSIGGES